MLVLALVLLHNLNTIEVVEEYVIRKVVDCPSHFQYCGSFQKRHNVYVCVCMSVFVCGIFRVFTYKIMSFANRHNFASFTNE